MALTPASFTCAASIACTAAIPSKVSPEAETGRVIQTADRRVKRSHLFLDRRDRRRPASDGSRVGEGFALEVEVDRGRPVALDRCQVGVGELARIGAADRQLAVVAPAEGDRHAAPLIAQLGGSRVEVQRLLGLVERVEVPQEGVHGSEESLTMKAR